MRISILVQFTTFLFTRCTTLTKFVHTLCTMITDVIGSQQIKFQPDQAIGIDTIPGILLYRLKLSLYCLLLTDIKHHMQTAHYVRRGSSRPL